ncbi:DUF1707 SHOCT-like domain-containing protein [Glycomyces albidus]|uniref:DUF1707 SHOCT-like domain-containing protein n=1 Tax=Glycomyces albidus TaxID=2656774 RepID=UPI0012907701|nr:DUF1707 domain-containing protein [Glycomyces albidus]
MTDDRLRISNADRDLAIQQLQAALDEGRIDLAEFDERAKAVYGAKTNAELDIVFEDLPGGRPKAGEVATASTSAVDAPAEPARAASSAPDKPRGIRLKDVPALRGLVTVGLICTGVWFATWIGTGEPTYFWPIWPILGLGIATIVQVVNLGFDGRGDDEDGSGRDDRGHGGGHGRGHLGH